MNYTDHEMDVLTSIAKPHYQQTHRHYHNCKHFEDMLDYGMKTWDISNGLALAIIFHDIVYVPGFSGNEEASVQLMRTLLSKLDFILKSDIDHAEDLIQWTAVTAKHGPVSSDFDEKNMMTDLDYLGFAVDSPLYRPFTEYLIREEFCQYTSDQFVKGRIKFLEMIVDRNPFFTTPAMEGAFGNSARKTIQGKIDGLYGLLERGAEYMGFPP